MQKALLVIILSVFLASFSWAQDSLDNSQSEELILDDRSGLQPLDWNEQQLNDYREDSSYDYTEKQPQDNWLTRFRTWLGRMWDSFWQWLLGDGEISGFWLQLIKALPYLIVAGIIVFMVWLLIRLNPGPRYWPALQTRKSFLPMTKN
ncbi:hypothetical protein [Aureitalea marina]|uniref:DUF4129 domain-containing protein n=1 Tax=Aureitalea marina TaxID=930804 RepID=A0A2S7KPW4_9FLAO|nr:hypothetical protein [Aureitalea marina]PQB04650.1 hypothetical protein BST85_06885 [Aureitalea marina]